MAEQLKMVNLKCASCGGDLEIFGDMERLAFGCCESEQIIERLGGTIGLKLVVDAMAHVQLGANKTAAELAVVRLDKELGIARARWQEAEAEFCRRNKASSRPAVAMIVLSVIAFLGALGIFSNAAIGIPGVLDIGSMVLSIVLAGAAIVVFILAFK